MKHIVVFLAFAACGTTPTQTSVSHSPPREQSPQAPAPPTVQAAAAIVSPAVIPWKNWPGNGVVTCHFSDPNMVTADLTVTIDGDTHTGTLTVTDVATGLSGSKSATYRPVAQPTSLEIVTGTSVSWYVEGPHMLGWVAGLDIETMTMYLACGGEYAASHGLCLFPHGVPQAACSYTAAP